MAWSPTIIEGARGTAQTHLLDGINSRRGFSFDSQLTQLVPNEAPFLSTLLKYKRISVNDPDHKYQEHRPAWLDDRYVSLGGSITCSGGYGGKTHTVTVTSTELLSGADSTPAQRYIFQLVDADDPSKYCNFLLYEIASDTSIKLLQLTDLPGFNGASGDKLHIIGTAFAEGTDKTIATYDKVDIKWASCQIFKTLVQASRTTMKTWVAGGNEWERLHAEAAVTHKVDMERAFLFGSRCINTSDQGSDNNPFGAPVAGALDGGGVGTDTYPVRTSISIQQAAAWADSVGMGGSRQFNNTMANYTYFNFLDDLSEVFEFGSESRYFFGGRGVRTFLNKMALSKDTNIIIENDTNQAGVQFKRFITDAGDLNFVTHPLFRGDYAYKMFGVDLNNIELMVFDPTFVEENVHTPGYDGKEDQYVSDMGLIVHFPEATVSEFNFL